MPFGKSIQAREHPFSPYQGKWVDIGIGDKIQCGVLADIRHDGYLVLTPYLSAIHTSHDLPYRLEISNDRKTIGPEQLVTSINPVNTEEVQTRIKEYERSFQHASRERERKISELEQKVDGRKKGK